MFFQPRDKAVVSIRTPDPEKTAAFYKEVLALAEVGLARAGIYLSDGYINLAILKSKDEGAGESPRDMPGYDREPAIMTRPPPAP